MILSWALLERMPALPGRQSWQGRPSPESRQGQALGPAERKQVVWRVCVPLLGPEARKFKFQETVWLEHRGQVPQSMILVSRYL